MASWKVPSPPITPTRGEPAFTSRRVRSTRLERPVVRWVQTGPLFTPAVMLQIMNLDGMDRHRLTGALLTNGKRVYFDENPNDDHWENRGYLPPGRIPVGMIGVRMLSSSFDQNWWREPAVEITAENLELKKTL